MSWTTKFARHFLKLEQFIMDYMNLQWLWRADSKFCYEGNWLASRGLPSDAE